MKESSEKKNSGEIEMTLVKGGPVHGEADSDEADSDKKNIFLRASLDQFVSESHDSIEPSQVSEIDLYVGAGVDNPTYYVIMSSMAVPAVMRFGLLSKDLYDCANSYLFRCLKSHFDKRLGAAYHANYLTNKCWHQHPWHD